MKIITQEIKKQILLDYLNNIKVKDISIKFNLNIRTIFSIVRKNNLPHRQDWYHRKYIYNENIFDIIDNSEKSYWLGFLMADGWISNYTINLSLKDSEMIYKFRKFIGNESIPIKDVENGVGVLNQKMITLNSKKLVCCLKKYGLIQNKTLRTQILNIPEIYIWDFVRGYFDGDGCIYYSKTFRHCEMIMASCSFKILSQINDLIIKNNIYGSSIRSDKKGKCFYLRIRNKKEIIDFYRLIYKNANIFLERKYVKFKKIEEIFLQRQK